MANTDEVFLATIKSIFIEVAPEDYDEFLAEIGHAGSHVAIHELREKLPEIWDWVQEQQDNLAKIFFPSGYYIGDGNLSGIWKDNSGVFASFLGDDDESDGSFGDMILSLIN